MWNHPVWGVVLRALAAAGAGLVLRLAGVI